jgi:hypothetical protein
LDLSLGPFDRLSVRDWQACYSVAKDRIRKAQDAYAAQANKHRLPDPFKIDDLVLLSIQDFVPPNLRGRPTNKLANVYSGPYKIIEKIGTSYFLPTGPFIPSSIPINFVHTSGITTALLHGHHLRLRSVPLRRPSLFALFKTTTTRCTTMSL